MKSTIITYTDIEPRSFEWQNKKSVLVGGCFDVLHFGHITFLQKAKEAGDTLIVALESDSFIIDTKKRKPVHSQEERAYILTALKMIDYVILLPRFTKDADYNTLVGKVKPAIIAVTAGDPAISKKRDFATRIKASVVEVTPLLSTFSTTNILNYENFHRH